MKKTYIIPSTTTVEVHIENLMTPASRAGLTFTGNGGSITPQDESAAEGTAGMGRGNIWDDF